MLLRQILVLLLILFCLPVMSQVPPSIKDPAVAGLSLRPEQKQFALTFRQLQPFRTMVGDPSGVGLRLDLHDTSLYGKVYVGPAYFEYRRSDYPEVRFRTSSDIVQGRASISLKPYFDPNARGNVNEWVNAGILGYRMEITRMRGGKPVNAGIYDSRVYFRLKDSMFVPIVSIIEPPMVALIESDHPEWMMIGFTVDRPCKGAIDLEKVGLSVDEDAVERHEVQLRGLRPSTRYRYRALAIDGNDTAATPWHEFTTAPRKGEGSVVFGYAGDGRASAGGGEYEYVGVNRYVGAGMAREIFRRNASFLLYGGDLIGGYTNSRDDFEMELVAFRETFGPFLSARPLYAAVGNHDSFVNGFDDGSRYGLAMDKWPYETSSGEAVFARMFIQPTNGPKAVYGRPPYDETAFSFQYGPVKVIVVNNDYWVTSQNRIQEFGGSPEGYILPEQLDWIKEEVRKGDADPTVRYVLILSHEPAFPGGGHVGDAMWHGGNNNHRAYSFASGTGQPAGPGIVEVRNEFWKIASQSKKVAIVLGSDEHNYQRYLITKNTPVGIPSKDDLNGNGILDDGQFSGNPEFTRPLWHVISGGAGAPYYTQENAPWSGSSKYFSSQYNFLIFRADQKKIGMEVYSNTGQLLDRVDDLMAVGR